MSSSSSSGRNAQSSSDSSHSKLSSRSAELDTAAQSKAPNGQTSNPMNSSPKPQAKVSADRVGPEQPPMAVMRPSGRDSSKPASPTAGKSANQHHAPPTDASDRETHSYHQNTSGSRPASRSRPVSPRRSPRAGSVRGGSPRTARSVSPRGGARAREFSGSLQPHSPRSAAVDICPGPGSYAPASSIGKQSISTKRSGQTYSFGRSGRDSYDRQYVERDAQSRMPTRTTQDVEFADREKLGTTATSNRPSSPRFRFPQSRRDDYTSMYITKQQRAGVPGKLTKDVDYAPPETYSTFKPLSDSRLPSSPRHGFAKSPRSGSDKQYTGQREAQKRVPTSITSKVDYMPADAAERTPDSRKKTAPSYGFGTARREAFSKRYFKPHM